MDSELIYLLASEAAEVSTPSILVWRNSGSTTTISTSSIVPYNAVSSSSGLFTSSSLQSSGAVVVPASGLYQITARIAVQNPVQGTFYIVGIAIGSSSTPTVTTHGNTTYNLQASGTGTAGFNAGLEYNITAPVAAGQYIAAIAGTALTSGGLASAGAMPASSSINSGILMSITNVGSY